MVGVHHREPGTAGAALSHDEIYAQAIVDFIHLHPAIVKLLVRAKGVERTVLITDAMRAAGLPDGERSEEHTSELQSRQYLVCRLLLEKKNNHTQVDMQS